MPKTLLTDVQNSIPKLVNSLRFFNEMLSQIRASEMESFIPLEVWVYDEHHERNDVQRKWCIGPGGSWRSWFAGKDNEHVHFNNMTHMFCPIDECVTENDYVLLIRAEKPLLTFAVFDISASGATCMDVLNQEAAKHGLKLEQRYIPIRSLKLPYLYLSR